MTDDKYLPPSGSDDHDEQTHSLIQAKLEPINQHNRTTTTTKVDKFMVVGNAFVQRDYSDGESRDINFESEKFPPQLENRLEPQVFTQCINEINFIFKPLAKKTSYNLIESWVSMFTCFLWRTRFSKTIARLDDLLDQQNKEIFIPRGLQILNPYRTGFRNIQIVMYKIPQHPDSIRGGQNSISVGSPPQRGGSLMNKPSDIGTSV